MNKENNNIAKRVIRMFKPFTKQIILVVICVIISSSLNVIKPLINKNIVDNGLIQGNFNVIILNSLLYLAIAIVMETMEIINNKYRVYIEAMVSYNLGRSAFDQTLKLKMEFFNKTNYAEIISNLGIDIGNIAQICNQNTFYMLTSIFRLIVGIIGLMIISWKLCILVFILIPFKYIVTQIFTKIKKRLVKLNMNSYKEYSSWFGDTIGGIKEIKIFGLEEIKKKEFVEKQDEIIKTNIKMGNINKYNSSSESIFENILTFTIYILGGWMVIKDSITVGGLFAFLTYCSYVTIPISSILNIKYTFASVIPSAKRYFEFIDMENEYSGNKEKLKKVNREIIQGDLKFENVNFSYVPGIKTLNNINFEIKAKEKVAIIGNNGSGKTTLINLIMRFIKVDSGRVLLDGQDINSFDIRDYRSLLSMVNQDIYLFNTSIKDNIMQGDGASKEILKSASEKSAAHEFINKLENGYESIAGQRGFNLSGGERQKIAMARAFARDSKILILDEATSNYDIDSEKYVNKILKEYFNDRTVIIITHRAEILEKMDKVIVLKDGIIQDIGNHVEFEEKNEFYRQLIKNPVKV
ncbi:ABC transporter ATP-binding protein/permease [Clostridium sporogenes]|uniref:ABC transporter ATP-binding protein n=1 Tax=Clostridium sporogenes TaxID=1509 RepID=UPI002237DCF9|nr:ABC transporter ATP-binding protein [Clostridium sporogenes]MCW6060205.1 ABC transporter ATP-binding protein/permease [Clostridium sporogenes]MCW6068151.1 ABC transporter ATP-binding protein/permease [Clostridium sporogenes]